MTVINTMKLLLCRDSQLVTVSDVRLAPQRQEQVQQE